MLPVRAMPRLDAAVSNAGAFHRDNSLSTAAGPFDELNIPTCVLQMLEYYQSPIGVNRLSGFCLSVHNREPMGRCLRCLKVEGNDMKGER